MPLATATAVKTKRVLTADGTSIAAAGNLTSSAWNGTTALGGVLVATVTPSGTLTVGCTVQANISPDGTNWYQFAAPVSGLVSGTVYPFVFDLPPGTMNAEVVWSGHTGNAVTVGAHVEELTSVVYN